MKTKRNSINSGGKSAGAASDCKEKERARAARNKAQAKEESRIWKDTARKAEKAITSHRKAIGRPAMPFDPVKADEILTLLSEGIPATKIMRMEGFPTASVLNRWIAENPSFSSAYMRAREEQGDYLFAECVEIADSALESASDLEGAAINAAIQHARLRIDTRMRVAAKYNNKYADKPSAEVYVDNRSVTVDSRALEPEARERLRQLLLLARPKPE
jgi:hypothetical protein